ncbi:uncharacterized protein LOC116341453 [Contarinia nasturtii]|uniref:uncharacterized protein LOC116341453 n=1 Tax=Contarinia nasturtii TaxID=265458 RepID=UPI0012D42EB4|nr:uncharacterized protein LOC116341453 [Contarinia nasturtii]
MVPDIRLFSLLIFMTYLCFGETFDLICGRRTSYTQKKGKPLNTKKKLMLYKIFKSRKEYEEEKAIDAYGYYFWEILNFSECCVCCIEMANSSKTEYCVRLRSKSIFGIFKKTKYDHIENNKFDRKSHAKIDKKRGISSDCCPYRNGYTVQT